jgi:hypothetical protein
MKCKICNADLMWYGKTSEDMEKILKCPKCGIEIDEKE